MYWLPVFSTIHDDAARISNGLHQSQSGNCLKQSPLESFMSLCIQTISSARWGLVETVESLKLKLSDLKLIEPEVTKAINLVKPQGSETSMQANCLLKYLVQNRKDLTDSEIHAEVFGHMYVGTLFDLDR
jgi:hypothetical protein